jgi:hypothetical protein
MFEGRPSAVDLLLIFLVFIAGFGCGYYLSDRLKRHRSLISTPKRKNTEPNLLDFKKTSMRELWDALRNRPPHS